MRDEVILLGGGWYANVGLQKREMARRAMMQGRIRMLWRRWIGSLVSCTGSRRCRMWLGWAPWYTTLVLWQRFYDNPVLATAAW